MLKLTALENKLRSKNADLQRREDRIVTLEDELRAKVAEVSK